MVNYTIKCNSREKKGKVIDNENEAQKNRRKEGIIWK